MNIVVINDSASINGGAAKVALTEAMALAEAGHAVHLVCGSGPVAPQLAKTRNLTVHQLDILDINVDPSRMRAMTLGLWNPQTYRFVRDLLQSLERGQTVVHAHSWTRALSSSALQAALASTAPVTLTLHDYLMGCPQGTFFDQLKSDRCSLKPMGMSCLTTNCDRSGYAHKLFRVGRKLVQDKVSGAPGRIRDFIYLSRSSLEQLTPYLPADARLHYLPNPIDVQRMESAEVEHSDVFCFAGRFVPEKGALLFAQAAELQGVAAQFVGDGPQRDEILHINPSAQMLGWMDSTTMTETLRQARALVFPSVWNEVLGLIVLEAAAHGVPSIVPRGSGAEDSVVDGETGFHFESGDVKDLARKIELLKDSDLAARLGRAAYAKFWSNSAWTLPAHVAGLEGIYSQMLTRQQD